VTEYPSHERIANERARYRDALEDCAEADCQMCDGEGFIVVNTTRNGDPQHDREYPCPICTDLSAKTEKYWSEE
jgi:hypothetical protein